MSRRPVNKAAKAPQAVSLDITSRSGPRHYGGILQEELHRKLSSTQKLRVFMEMRDNDPVVGAMLFAVKMLMRHVRWKAEPASDKREAVSDAEFLTSAIEDLSHTWDDFVCEILSMLVFGWAFEEIVYKIRKGPEEANSRYRSKYTDGKIGWRKFILVPQESLYKWELDPEDGAPNGMWQQPENGGINCYIPIEKALLFRTEVRKSSPEGISALRNAYVPYYYLKRLQTFEAIGVERDLNGIPMLQVPPRMMSSAATADEKTTRSNLEQMVSEIRRDEREGIVIPAEFDEQGNHTGFKLTLLSSGGQRQVDTDKIIKRYEQRIAMSVLADFVMLGLDKVGSFALASSKTNLFAVSIGAWLQSIAAVFNRYAVPRLFLLNGMRRTDYPQMMPSDIEKIPLDELGQFLGYTAKTGLITPGRALERKLRQMVGLPEPEEEDMELPAIGADGLPVEPGNGKNDKIKIDDDAEDKLPEKKV